MSSDPGYKGEGLLLPLSYLTAFSSALKTFYQTYNKFDISKNVLRERWIR